MPGDEVVCCCPPKSCCGRFPLWPDGGFGRWARKLLIAKKMVMAEATEAMAVTVIRAMARRFIWLSLGWLSVVVI